MADFLKYLRTERKASRPYSKFAVINYDVLLEQDKWPQYNERHDMWLYGNARSHVKDILVNVQIGSLITLEISVRCCSLWGSLV